MDRVDCVVVGAGVIGLAIARKLARRGMEVIVLETEAEIGTHASSRNSEVIHAGIYYPTGSLKAELCVSGKAMLYEYCRAKDIRHQQVGKLIVAVSADETKILKHYQQQATANGVSDLAWLDADEIARMEPELCCVTGLLSPSTGIIDSHELMVSLVGDIEAAGGAVVCRSRVTEIEASPDGFSVRVTGDDDYRLPARSLVNAAGLWAPRVASTIRGLDPRAVPDAYYAKGHYFALSGKAPFSHLVYPVAGKAGLGVHLTLDTAGQGRFGPDVQWIDALDYSFDEARKSAFIAAIRKYYPGLDETRLTAGYTGIRPKLCGPNSGPEDFIIQGPEDNGIDGLVQLFGIESPGLTASLAIAARVADQLVRD